MTLVAARQAELLYEFLILGELRVVWIWAMQSSRGYLLDKIQRRRCIAGLTALLLWSYCLFLGSFCAFNLFGHGRTLVRGLQNRATTGGQQAKQDQCQYTQDDFSFFGLLHGFHQGVSFPMTQIGADGGDGGESTQRSLKVCS